MISIYRNRRVEYVESMAQDKPSLKYDESNIRSIEGIEQIRKRPTVFIGSLYAEGVYRLFTEAYANVVDEFTAGRGNTMRVNIECGNTIKGFAKLLCSHGGEKKKPIYIFKKRAFKRSSHKKSMVFYTMKSDYIVSFAFRSVQNNTPGIISLGIYRIFKQKSKNESSSRSAKEQLQYTLYTRLIYAKVSKIMNSSELNMAFLSQYPKTKFGPTSMLYQLFEHGIEEKHLSFLKPVINAAIEKSISFETTYTWYHPHSEKFVEEMRNADAI